MDSVQEEVLREKIEFFNGLKALENDDSDEPDPRRIASENILRRARAREQAHVPVNSQCITHAPNHSADVECSIEKSQHVVENNEQHTSNNMQRPIGLQRQPLQDMVDKVSCNNPRVATTISVSRKRKRKSDVLTVPEKQQIFKGLYFYFFPNNDIAPARRMRINKAIQFGATWQRDWNNDATHVILDKSLGFSALIKYLKLESFPEHVIMVRENYPADCIAYRALINPKLPLYAVERELSTVASALNSTIAEKSLWPKSNPKESLTLSTETQDKDQKVTSVSSNILAEAKSTEEMDQAITQARALQYAPLDADEDDEPYKFRKLEGLDYITEEPKGGLTLLKQRKPTFPVLMDKFLCMQKNTGDKANCPNQTTIEILQQMADYYVQTGDEWRVRAYRMAITMLRKQPTQVCTKEEALALPHVGERLASKIGEIVFTNKLRRLKNARSEPRDRVLQTFMQVYGAGFEQSSKWVDQGFSTLDHLLQSEDLTANQRIGIEHYEDFNQRIPRVEVEQHGNIVLHALKDIDPMFEVIIGGSYRRGSATSSDVDCIVTRRNSGITHIRNVVVSQLVPRLFAEGFLVAALATLTRDHGSKWHGASRIPASTTWRRLDLLLVPWDEMGAALIYFTGNDIFNRSIRLLASKRGMRLNQHGLYQDVMRGKRREKITTGSLVESKDERRIFEILGVPWRPPEHRIC